MATYVFLRGFQRGACLSPKALFRSSYFASPVSAARALALPLGSTQTISTTTRTNAAAHASHNHSTHWTIEKAISAALVGVVPLAIAVPNPALDYAVALSLTLHSHWGIEAVVVDYIRESMFGKVIPKIAVFGVYLVSSLTLGGLFYFNYTDVGIGQAIRMFWAL